MAAAIRTASGTAVRPRPGHVPGARRSDRHTSAMFSRIAVYATVLVTEWISCDAETRPSDSAVRQARVTDGAQSMGNVTSSIVARPKTPSAAHTPRTSPAPRGSVSGARRERRAWIATPTASSPDSASQATYSSRPGWSRAVSSLT